MRRWHFQGSQTKPLGIPNIPQITYRPISIKLFLMEIPLMYIKKEITTKLNENLKQGFSSLNTIYYFFTRIPYFSEPQNSYIFLNIEPRFFLNTKGATSPKNLRNMFQSWLVLYHIIKSCKSLHFILIMQKYT